jgi:RND family efflux transporter MFP subunit
MKKELSGAMSIGGNLLLCVLVMVTALTSGCGKNSTANGAQPQAPQAVPVKIQVAETAPVKNTTEYVATLKSRNSTEIMPQVEGHVTSIYVHSGEHVSPATPLMQIDPSKQQATVKSLQDMHAAQLANLQYAQQQYDRISQLSKAGVTSRQEYDQSKTALDAAQAQVRSLDAQVMEQKVQLHYYQVTSPTSGIVGDIPVRVGDRVTTSTMLTSVDKPGSLEAYVYVPIERASELHMNLPVQIVDGAGNVIADSRITFISPAVDNTTQSILAKATIANNQDKLRNAQFIRARIIWGTHEAPLVPVLAVSRIGGQYFAWVAEDQGGKLIAHQKPVKVGDMVGNNYVVMEGIKPGDKVVVSGTQFLVDGTPVAPQG